MKKTIKLNVTVEMVCDDPDFTETDMERLAEMHVSNCIQDNPDADNCTITSVDVCPNKD